MAASKNSSDLRIGLKYWKNKKYQEPSRMRFYNLLSYDNSHVWKYAFIYYKYNNNFVLLFRPIEAVCSTV